jgi:hypothetical protein
MAAFFEALRGYVTAFSDSSLAFHDVIVLLSRFVFTIRYWNAWLEEAMVGDVRSRSGLSAQTVCDAEISVAAAINLLGCWHDFNLSPGRAPNLSNMVRCDRVAALLYAYESVMHKLCVSVCMCECVCVCVCVLPRGLKV